MRIKIVSGQTKITSKGDIVFNTFDGDINFTAGGKNIWHGEKGIFIGEYEEVEIIKFPGSVDFECSKIKEYNIGVGETKEVRFKIGGKNDDEKRKIVFQLGNANISLSTIKWNAENEWILLTKITGNKVGDTIIKVFVDGVHLNNIKIKCINYKDVFSEEDVERLVNEINYIKPFTDSNFAPEYDENYCMQAAERGISELLKDTKNFYAVERNSHKHKNKIGFSGLNAIDRGNTFKENGFVKIRWTYNKYKLDNNKRKQINESKTIKDVKKIYQKVMYDIIELSSEEKNNIYNSFLKDINAKIGFHVYYFSITGGFHTLLLIINNMNPCKATYKIYDQHGESTSKGSLEEIGEGLRKQTSWTFANTCMNRMISHLQKSNNRHLHYDSMESIFWKIQRR